MASQSLKPAVLSLNSIPVDVQETIAFFVATGSGKEGPPSGLASLLLTSKHLSHVLSRSSLPHLYATIFRATFNCAAIVRRFPHDRYTARHLGDELVRRWECLKRIKAGDTAHTLEKDLWTVWMMCLENDGKNLHHLLAYANAGTFIKRFSKRHLLPQPHLVSATLSPSPTILQQPTYTAVGRTLPTDSTRNALALSIFWYLNESGEMAKETSAERAENQTMLRLFVFAAQKFDAFQAPWTHLYLPAPPTAQHPPPDPANAFIADLTLRSRSITIPYLGSQPLVISPPISAQAALLSFFARVALDSSLGVTEGGAPVPPPGISTFGAGGANAESGGEMREEESDGWGKVKRTSKDFDVDWERLTGCLDPVRRPSIPSEEGLGVWKCRGMFEGVWGGLFAFLDFDSYRDMLGGRTRAIYEGPFGLQPQIWRLTETLVLRPPHLSPFPTDSSSPHDFTPSALNAGFPPTWSTALSTADAEVLTGVPGYRLVDEKEEEEMREKWAKGGGVDEGLEIIVTGTGHSAWGRFYVSGRVRVWDGMVLLMKEYYPDSRGKWLYRGYVVAGGAMVGRWRDSFSEENYHGYEGSFHMTRRG